MAQPETPGKHFTIPKFEKYDADYNDELKIYRDQFLVPCRLCWAMFQRVRLTFAYCRECKLAFCTESHGKFPTFVDQDKTGGVRGVCVLCEYSPGWKDNNNQERFGKLVNG